MLNLQEVADKIDFLSGAEVEKENEGTFLITEQLKKAIDDIYKYPLKEYAKETLCRQMKSGISDDTLALLENSLRDEDKLAIIKDDNDTFSEPQIICSLGLINR